MVRHNRAGGKPVWRRRQAVIGAVVLLILSISGVAYAYWTTSGTGTGTATTGAGSTVTVTQLAPNPSGLAPGGAAQAVPFKVTNPASNPLHISTVTISITSVTYINAAGAGTGSTAADHPAGFTAVTCSSADFDITQPTAINADMDPGNTPFDPSGGTIAMINSAGNQDDCKSTTVHLAFAAA